MVYVGKEMHLYNYMVTQRDTDTLYFVFLFQVQEEIM